MSPPPASRDERPGDSRDDNRDAILEATLDHVAFEGWTRKALQHGLADLGLPDAAADLAFPGGMTEMIRYWSRSLDARMADAIAGASADPIADPMAGAGAPPPEARPLAARMADAIRLRLALAEPHREAVRRAISFMALPPYEGTLPRLTYDTVDAIWYAVGDRSTDFSFYTRRASLACIYAAVVLFWLDDTSEDGEATRAFIDRRLADFGRLHGIRRRLAGWLEGLARPFAGLSPGRPRG